MSSMPKAIIEALLLASGEPLQLKRLCEIVNSEYDASQIQQVLTELEQDYHDRGIRLVQLSSGYCFQTAPELKNWITRLFPENNIRCSRALLETLAVIAYRQPVTRGEVEAIRGVTVNSLLINTLLDYEWIRVVGQSQVPGRPNLYATTQQFLDHFNLKSLNDLPQAENLMPRTE